MPLSFLECGEQRLDEIVQHGLLCVFDFDGTLAPIVTRPDDARLPLGILMRLIALSRYAPVGIITGRSVTDLRACLGFEPDFIVGNHGLEGLSENEHQANQWKQLCRDWEVLLAAGFQGDPAIESAVRIENKGYSLSVHYRLARDQVTAEQRLAELLPRLVPSARLIAGKCVFNLVPEDAGDKGTALERLMQSCGATSAVYIGDDVTDEDVFRLSRPDLLTIRVGQEIHSAAEFFLTHRLDVLFVLDSMIGRLRRARIRNWLHAESARGT